DGHDRCRAVLGPGWVQGSRCCWLVLGRFATKSLISLLGMGGRAVEGTGLENRQGCKPLVGSNPTPSASRVWSGGDGNCRPQFCRPQVLKGCSCPADHGFQAASRGRQASAA